MDFKKEIAELVCKKIKLPREKVEQLITIPPQNELGDFALPCFTLAKKHKKNPAEISKQLEKEIKPNESIEKIKSAGPYLNFFVNKKILAEHILSQINDKYGKSKLGEKQKVIIDFSAPNIGKPMHIGHIRSTIIGDSIMRTLNFLGYETIGINYLGDIGLHIGKLVVAYELWLDKKALEKDPTKELLRLYIKFCEKEKSEFNEGQDEPDDYSNNEWTEKAREKLRLIELGDKKTCAIWRQIRDISGKEFDKVYQILKINFNETTGQSFFSEKGKEIVSNALRKGLATVEKDSNAVFMEFENLPKKYILRSNGTASYITQDIAAAVERYKKYKFDKMVYVTDYRQLLHFQQLFEILKKIGYDFYKKCVHVKFGTVNFGKEIMATREGKVLLLEEVLRKTIEKAKQEIKKRKTKGDAEKVGVASIKYAILRNEPVKDVEFSWKNALNFEGETGPYLQYSYARAGSIIKKAGEEKNVKVKTGNFKLKEEEIKLIKKLGDFPEIAKEAGEKLSPNILANYSFQLAQIFNEFYANCKVVGSKEESLRLKLVEAFRITIKNALYLLGIEVMEEM